MAESSEILDLEMAAELIPGGPEAVKDLAKVLIEESTQRLQTMRQALTNGDAAAVGLKAHPLKSGAAVFGAEAAAKAAEQVEHMGQEGKLDEVKAGFAKLEEEFSRLHVALRAVISSDPV